MTENTLSATIGQGHYSLLGKVGGAEKLLLSGRRNRQANLESVVTFFHKALRVIRQGVAP